DPRGLRPQAGADHPVARPPAADLLPHRLGRPLRQGAARVHLGAYGQGRRAPRRGRPPRRARGGLTGRQDHGMGLFEAIVLGLVQGLTEFLPISSTAHLRVIPALLGWADPGAAFSAVIQIGTVLAVFVYFRADL